MLMPIGVMIAAGAGLLLCGIAFFRSRERPAPVPDVPANALNKDVDLAQYRPTDQSSVFAHKSLPSHPFKVGKGGIFCGVCLITSTYRHSSNPVQVHTHLCTVIRKDWKIMVCRDEWNTEYFISEDIAFFRKR